jgi:hypothetical protein
MTCILVFRMFFVSWPETCPYARLSVLAIVLAHVPVLVRSTGAHRHTHSKTNIRHYGLPVNTTYRNPKPSEKSIAGCVAFVCGICFHHSWESRRIADRSADLPCMYDTLHHVTLMACIRTRFFLLLSEIYTGQKV